jgi:hypothetical protein
MKNHLSIAFFVLLLVNGSLLSCKKDKTPTPIIPPTGDNCPEMYNLRTDEYLFPIFKNNDLGPCMMGFEHIDTNEYLLVYPVVNPNNPFEIAFLRFENNADQMQIGKLYVYNFCENHLKELHQNARGSKILWTKNNEIIFQDQSFNVMSIKPDGTNEHEIFQTSKVYIKIASNPTGDIFLINKPNALHDKLIFNTSGEIIKEFAEPMNSFVFVNDSSIVFNWMNKLYTYNIYTDLKNHIDDFYGIMNLIPTSTTGDYVVQTNNGNYLYTNNNFQLIDSNFANYQAYDFQPLSHNKYLLNRIAIDTVQVAVCSTYIYKRLSVFDKLTGVEREIKFQF